MCCYILTSLHSFSLRTKPRLRRKRILASRWSRVSHRIWPAASPQTSPRCRFPILLYCYVAIFLQGGLFIICISYNLFQNTLKDEDSNAFWNRSSFKETNIYQEQTHSRSLSYKERNKSIITTSPSNQTPVLSPQPPSPPCTKPPEDENNCPTLDINDTKTFTDYYSFPPITLIDDLEVWDEEEDE